MNLTPPRRSGAETDIWIGLRREIDEVLEEIDRVEAEVLELFADIGGDEALRKVVAYKREQERLSPLKKATPEASPEPETSPPATR